MTIGSGSPLTDQELLISQAAQLDVGAGYPNLELPPWMRAIITDNSDFDLTYGFSPQVSNKAVRQLTSDLLVAVCDLLGLQRDFSDNGFVTFSGSAALNRTVETLVKTGRTVISSSPTIDIIPSMIGEQAGAHAIYIPTKSGFDVDLDRIREMISDTTDCIILTSPENPSGNVISESDLTEIARLAIDHGVTLVVDQCFALIDPFATGVPLLPDVAPEGLSWVFLWDTGKTFGLNEDKLGFLFCSADLKGRLSQSLNVLQFDVSRRLKIMFRRLFEEATRRDYPSFLSNRVRANIELAEEACAGTGLRPIRPDAGSFLLLDVTHSRYSAEDLCNRLLIDHGLGLIRTNSFFQPDHNGAMADDHDTYLRVAMAREEVVIQTAFSRISAAV
jgi:aspartate/methionine/tyrosine aminotransferase